jgi:hypothetical protein
MKIPKAEQARTNMKNADPLFDKLPDHVQGLMINAYQQGYHDACLAASKIAEEHEKQSKD